MDRRYRHLEKRAQVVRGTLPRFAAGYWLPNGIDPSYTITHPYGPLV